MSEMPPDNTEQDNTYPIDKELVVGRLQELGVDIEPEDLDDLDDEEVMTVILTHATMYDLDIDDVLRETAPVEKRRKEELGE